MDAGYNQGFPEDRLVNTYFQAIMQNLPEEGKPGSEWVLRNIIAGALKVAYRRGYVSARLPYTRTDIEDLGHEFFRLAERMGRIEAEQAEQEKMNG